MPRLVLRRSMVPGSLAFDQIDVLVLPGLVRLCSTGFVSPRLRCLL